MQCLGNKKKGRQGERGEEARARVLQLSLDEIGASADGWMDGC